MQSLRVDENCWVPTHLSPGVSGGQGYADHQLLQTSLPKQGPTTHRRVITCLVYLQYSGGQGSYRSGKTKSLTEGGGPQPWISWDIHHTRGVSHSFIFCVISKNQHSLGGLVPEFGLITEGIPVHLSKPLLEVRPCLTTS